jgi:hypothetical protein
MDLFCFYSFFSFMIYIFNLMKFLSNISKLLINYIIDPTLIKHGSLWSLRRKILCLSLIEVRAFDSSPADYFENEVCCKPVCCMIPFYMKMAAGHWKNRCSAVSMLVEVQPWLKLKCLLAVTSYVKIRY